MLFKLVALTLLALAAPSYGSSLEILEAASKCVDGEFKIALSNIGGTAAGYSFNGGGYGGATTTGFPLNMDICEADTYTYYAVDARLERAEADKTLVVTAQAIEECAASVPGQAASLEAASKCVDGEFKIALSNPGGNAAGYSFNGGKWGGATTTGFPLNMDICEADTYTYYAVDRCLKRAEADKTLVVTAQDIEECAAIRWADRTNPLCQVSDSYGGDTEPPVACAENGYVCSDGTEMSRDPEKKCLFADCTVSTASWIAMDAATKIKRQAVVAAELALTKMGCSAARGRRNIQGCLNTCGCAKSFTDTTKVSCHASCVGTDSATMAANSQAVAAFVSNCATTVSGNSGSLGAAKCAQDCTSNNLNDPTAILACVAKCGSGNGGGMTCSFWQVGATRTDNANYAPCVGLGNGATCTPTCANGYSAITAATGFTLNCPDTGAFLATDPTLICCLADWPLKHCSAYSIGNGPPSTPPPTPPPSTSPPPVSAADPCVELREDLAAAETAFADDDDGAATQVNFMAAIAAAKQLFVNRGCSRRGRRDVAGCLNSCGCPIFENGSPTSLTDTTCITACGTTTDYTKAAANAQAVAAFTTKCSKSVGVTADTGANTATADPCVALKQGIATAEANLAGYDACRTEKSHHHCAGMWSGASGRGADDSSAATATASLAAAAIAAAAAMFL